MNYSKHRIAAIVFVCIGITSFLLGGVFGVRITQMWRESPPHRIRETNTEAIQAWMTLGYISKTYGIPLEEFEKSLSLEPTLYQRYSLTKIANQTQQTESELLTKIKEVVAEFQTAHPTPPAK